MKKNVTFKNAVLIVSLVVAGISVQAQDLKGTGTTTDPEIAKQGAATLGKVGTGLADGGSVRVVDNKGTIKFLQVQNGITQVTSKTPAGGIITTWQLGGALTDDTYIDATGKKFALDGLQLVPATLKPSTNAADKGKHTDAAGPIGYTFLVRDEATGETLKLLPSELVKTGVANKAVATAATDMVYGASGNVDAAFAPSDISKVSVYRNGVKLLANDNYIFVAPATAGAAATLTIKGTAGTDPEDYSLIVGDRIEIQWIN